MDVRPRFGGTAAGGAEAAAAGGGPCDDHVAQVYRYAQQHGAIDSVDAAALALALPAHEVFAAVAQLVELQMMVRAGGRLVPVDPESAATLLISPIERAIFQGRDQADRLRQRIEAVARPRTGTVDAVEGMAEIRGLLKLASDVCRAELVVLRPSHEDEEAVDGLIDACSNVLNREVGVRIVCPHRFRADFASRAKAKRLIEGGAQIRTVSQVSQTAFVFDRSLAVIVDLPAGDALPGARRVRDGNLVQFLVEMVEQLWAGATPFALEEDLGYAGDVADDLQRSIARLMAQGLTDEVVARRLGMSVRTCRRHIAALLHNLDSVSRFQAGVQAARLLTAE
jgi:DNA-binding CsgD family transcriptional regulator